MWRKNLFFFQFFALFLYKKKRSIDDMEETFSIFFQWNSHFHDIMEKFDPIINNKIKRKNLCVIFFQLFFKKADIREYANGISCFWFSRKSNWNVSKTFFPRPSKKNLFLFRLPWSEEKNSQRNKRHSKIFDAIKIFSFVFQNMSSLWDSAPIGQENMLKWTIILWKIFRNQRRKN